MKWMICFPFEFLDDYIGFHIVSQELQSQRMDVFFANFFIGIDLDRMIHQLIDLLLKI